MGLWERVTGGDETKQDVSVVHDFTVPSAGCRLSQVKKIDTNRMFIFGVSSVIKQGDAVLMLEDRVIVRCRVETVNRGVDGFRAYVHRERRPALSSCDSINRALGR